MENYDALLTTLALLMGTSWASGINLYAVLLVLGLGGSTGYIDLPAELSVLEDPLIIGAAGVMYCIEFFADKIPGVDSMWDAVHTFIRIPAGAMLAAGAVGDVTPVLEIAAGILGGGIAATSHTVKAGTRLMINTSPEPVSNGAASISEDLLVLSGLWAALNYPLLFLILFVVFIILLIGLLPKLWDLIKVFFVKIGILVGLKKKISNSMDISVESGDMLKEVREESIQAQLPHFRKREPAKRSELLTQKNNKLEHKSNKDM